MKVALLFYQHLVSNLKLIGFKINLYEGWRDKTIYTFTGPVTDGFQSSCDHPYLIPRDGP